MQAPPSLPARLYLLAYDLDRDRMYRSPYLGRALRAAAVTELYHQGRVIDEEGKVHPAPSAPGRPGPADAGRSGARHPGARHQGPGPRHQGPGQRQDPGPQHPPPDQLCADVLAEILASSRRRSWKHWVNHNQRKAAKVVRDQLAAGRWIRVEHRKILGIIPATRVTVRDRAMLRQLERALNQVLRGTISSGRAEPELASLAALLAAGEIGALRRARTRRALRGRLAPLNAMAGPAVPALRAAIRDQQASSGGG